MSRHVYVYVFMRVCLLNSSTVNVKVWALVFSSDVKHLFIVELLKVSMSIFSYKYFHVLL